jgi:hypothetical protein
MARDTGRLLFYLLGELCSGLRWLASVHRGRRDTDSRIYDPGRGIVEHDELVLAIPFSEGRDKPVDLKVLLDVILESSLLNPNISRELLRTAYRPISVG